ncbi:MAG TPA: Yip1 family protein [Gemmatimonadaceae bacterium]|jgi:hypothetical protein|nr:Yip1 family protein [Gemmatimonadaceae bacterium]
MTESTASVAPSKPTESSFWEDVIDIFYQPAEVFRRRQNRSVWPPMLFVAISIGVIFFATFNTLEPLFAAEFTRQTAKVLAKNPQITQEMMDKQRSIGEAFTRYGIGVVVLVTMFILGVVAWLVGKLVGSKQTFQAALVVAAWSYMPRVLGAVIGGVQGLLMDPAKLTGQMSISLSPARFMDPDTSNPLLFQLMGRFDLITIWVTILLAIGLYVTGKVSKDRAAVFGILIWIIGSLPALRTAYMAM